MQRILRALFLLAAAIPILYIENGECAFWYKAWQSTGWPTTQATITVSQMVRHPKSRQRVLPDMGAGRGKCPEGLDLQYRYSVGAQQYDGYKYIYGTETCDPDGDQALVKKYPAGSATAVHYDPRDPAESVMVPGQVTLGTKIITPLFLVTFLMIAGACFFTAFPPKGRFNFRDVMRLYKRNPEVIRKLREHPELAARIRKDPALIEAILKDPAALDDLLKK